MPQISVESFVKVMKPQDLESVEELGKSDDGHLIARINGKIVFLCDNVLTLSQIELFNEQPYACKILSLLD
jgi:hypothetical protein